MYPLLDSSQPELPYCLISEPLAYHSDQLTTNKGIWALKATFCSALLGWAANLPALFETQIIFNTHEYWEKFENGTSYYVSPITNSLFQIRMILALATAISNMQSNLQVFQSSGFLKLCASY